ncbi:MAG: hypothetical protein NC340_05080 [Ruminococcus flavefaciens]|nr:hypothetical protein [Ruminococcus flavefaciens]MCM1231095.1 hypothetical protein [Ruminococcus flavefaciens]
MMNYYKLNKINMYLEHFSDEQLDEIIKILLYILTLTLHPDWVTSELRFDVHNKVIESIDKIEDIEKQLNEE